MRGINENIEHRSSAPASQVPGEQEGERTIRDDSALDDGAHEARALLEAQALEAAADGVDEAEPGSLERELGRDLGVVHIVRDVYSA